MAVAYNSDEGRVFEAFLTLYQERQENGEAIKDLTAQHKDSGIDVAALKKLAQSQVKDDHKQRIDGLRRLKRVADQLALDLDWSL